MKIRGKRAVVGLDLSSGQIRAIAGLWDSKESKMRVVGASQIKSFGLEAGRVTDMIAASDCLATVIRDLRKSAALNLGLAYVGISGTHFDGFCSEVKISISNQRGRQITTADLTRLDYLSSNISLPLERCLVQRIVQEYSIDNQSGVKNPAGMIGSYLTSHNYIITGPRSAMTNLKKCLANAGLILGGFVMAGIAAGYSLTDRTQARSKNMLINIRDITTDVVIYAEGSLRFFEVFRGGDRHLVERISQHLSLPLDVAENIKQKYGCVKARLINPEERVIIPGGNGKSRSITRQELAKIMEPGLRELFFKIKEKIERSNYLYSPIESVTITGLGCLSDGTIEITEDVFECPVKMGLARNSIAEAWILNSPEWSTALGLGFYGLKATELNRETKYGLVGSCISRIRTWIEEYF